MCLCRGLIAVPGKRANMRKREGMCCDAQNFFVVEAHFLVLRTRSAVHPNVMPSKYIPVPEYSRLMSRSWFSTASIISGTLPPRPRSRLHPCCPLVSQFLSVLY